MRKRTSIRALKTEATRFLLPNLLLRISRIIPVLTTLNGLKVTGSVFLPHIIFYDFVLVQLELLPL